MLDLRVSWKGILNSGRLRIEFAPRDAKKIGAYVVRSSAYSLGAAAAFFPYKGSSWSELDPATLRPRYFRAEETTREETVTTTNRYRRGAVECHEVTTPRGAKTGKTKTREFRFSPLFDVFSAILQIRSQKLDQGDVINLVIHPFNNPYLLQVEVLGRERHLERKTIRLSVGMRKIDRKTMALKRYKKIESKATLWLSDDADRIPVELRADDLHRRHPRHPRRVQKNLNGRRDSDELGLDEKTIGAVALDQFVVAAAFHDPAVVENEDAVGMADGGETVGDDQAGAAVHEPFERFVDEALALGIEGGGGLVEQENARIGEDGAGDGDALALAAGELGAARADEGFVTLRQGGDEVVGVRLFRGRAWISSSDAPGCPYSMFSRMLPPKSRTSCGTMAICERMACSESSAAGRPSKRTRPASGSLKPRIRPKRGGFPRAGGTDERDALAGLDLEVEFVEHLDVRPRRVAEGKVLECDGAGELDGGVAILALGREVEQFAQAVGGAGGLLELGDDFRKRSERGADEDREQDEVGEVFPGDLVGGEHPRAMPGDEGDGAEQREDDEGKEAGAVFRPAFGHIEKRFERARVARVLRRARW